MTSPLLVPHNRPTLGLEEEEAAARVLKSGWVAQGPEVAAFENEMCGFLGLPEGHAVAVSSGTAALFLALRAVGAQASTVVCSVYACAALVNAIEFAGAKPRFVDVMPGRPNPDSDRLANDASPIAIIAHMFGQPVDMSAVSDSYVVEDCAQALGARLRGRPVGREGRIAIFSFYATKLITTGGQGGMVVSADTDLVAAVRDFREFDCRNDRKVRFNLQMTDLQAAVGRAQLSKIHSFVARRAEIFESYRSAGLDLIDTPVDGAPVRHRAVLRTREPRLVIDTLARAGIRAIVPVEDWELLAAPEQFPNAAHLSRTTVSLPIYPSLHDRDIAKIIDVLRGLDRLY